jgi:hypothetical protein
VAAPNSVSTSTCSSRVAMWLPYQVPAYLGPYPSHSWSIMMFHTGFHL